MAQLQTIKNTSHDELNKVKRVNNVIRQFGYINIMNWGLNSVFMDTKTIVTHIILCVQLPIKHISKNEML